MSDAADNKRRCKRALSTLKQYALINPKRDFQPGEVEVAISDLLADIRHLCDSMEIDFAQCDCRAVDHYTQEKVIPLKK